MIILADVLLGGCSIYTPRTTDVHGRPMEAQYYLWFSKGANGHLDIEWNVPKREDRQPTKFYRSKIQPIVSMSDYDYPALAEHCAIAKARNIPLDMLFVDTTVDIQLNDDGYLLGIVSSFNNIKDVRSMYHD